MWCHYWTSLPFVFISSFAFVFAPPPLPYFHCWPNSAQVICDPRTSPMSFQNLDEQSYCVWRLEWWNRKLTMTITFVSQPALWLCSVWQQHKNAFVQSKSIFHNCPKYFEKLHCQAKSRKSLSQRTWKSYVLQMSQMFIIDERRLCDVDRLTDRVTEPRLLKAPEAPH